MIVTDRPPWSEADINMQNVPDIMAPRSGANDQTPIMNARATGMIDMNVTVASKVARVRPPIATITKDALTTVRPEKIPHEKIPHEKISHARILRDRPVPIVITLTHHFPLLFPRTSPQAP